MSELSITEARDELAAVVNRVQYAGERTYLTRHGRRVAAVVPVSLLEAYEKAERQADLKVAHESEGNGESVEWEQVKAELAESDGRLAELWRQFIGSLPTIDSDADEIIQISPEEADELLGEYAISEGVLAGTYEHAAEVLGPGDLGELLKGLKLKEASRPEKPEVRRDS